MYSKAVVTYEYVLLYFGSFYQAYRLPLQRYNGEKIETKLRNRNMEDFSEVQKDTLE